MITVPAHLTQPRRVRHVLTLFLILIHMNGFVPAQMAKVNRATPVPQGRQI